MSFIIVYPTGSPPPWTGYGSRVRLQTSSGFAIGYDVHAYLIQFGTTSGILAAARAPVAGSSQLVDLIWGWDAVANVPAAMPLAGPSAFYDPTAATTCNLYVWETDGAGTTLDGPDTLFSVFELDPVSQGPFLTLSALFTQAQNQYNDIIFQLGQINPALATFRALSGVLTGHGSISPPLPTIGALTVTSTVPATWGFTYETPRRLIPAVGSIQFGKGTNLFDSHLIHYDRQIHKADAAYIDVINYNVKPGVALQIGSIG
jgi:hypothetical protein